MLRVGLLGASRIAPNAIVYPANRRDDVIISAVAARDEARAQEYAENYGIDRAYKGYDGVINDPDVDIVYNALPPAFHVEWTEKAVKAGKHVLCEKPFAMNGDEAAQMVDDAKAHNRHLIEAFHYRFHPLCDHVKAMIDQGAIGAIRHMEGSFAALISKRAGELRYIASMGGGGLMDLGCYPLHFMRTLMEVEPDVTKAKAHTDEDDPRVDVTMEAELAFGADVTAKLRSTMAPECGVRHHTALRIVGEKGEIIVQGFVQTHKGHSIKLIKDGVVETETLAGKTTYDHQLQHVIDVLKGNAEAITGGVDAISNMRAIDAIYAAAGLR